jgi:hypothetical protein
VPAFRRAAPHDAAAAAPVKPTGWPTGFTEEDGAVGVRVEREHVGALGADEQRALAVGQRR